MLINCFATKVESGIHLNVPLNYNITDFKLKI